MEAALCCCCQKPKGTLKCGLCLNAVCKKCSQELVENTFSFLAQVPTELTHRLYCGACYDSKVAPELASYEAYQSRAKRVFVYLNNQGEETRFIKRSEKPVHVVDCRDRSETLLRLAFFAAKAGFNGLVDVQITQKKLRNDAYQTSRYQGVGVPVRLDGEKLNLEKSKKLFPSTYDY